MYLDVSGTEVEFCVGSGGEEGDGKECQRRNVLHLFVAAVKVVRFERECWDGNRDE